MGGGGGWVFFFKQKTAYEILTCDWSSDVCSSDLKVPKAPKFEMGGSNVFLFMNRRFQKFPIYKWVVPMVFCLGTEGSNG